MLVYARDISRSFRIAAAMDPAMATFAVWEPTRLDRVPVATALGWDETHGSWRKYVFDHSRLDAYAALQVLRGDPPGMPGYSQSASENDFGEIRLHDLRYVPSRRLLARIARAAHTFLVVEPDLPIARCLATTDAATGSTVAVLSATHSLAQQEAPDGYSSVTVTVSASDSLRRGRIGNWSSGYLCTVCVDEDVASRCAAFLESARRSRDVSLLRLSTYGQVERYVPGLVTSLGRGRFTPKEAAILSSVRVHGDFGIACESLFLEIPQRSRRSVSIGVLRHSAGANVCVSGRLPADALEQFTHSLLAYSCDIVFREATDGQ
jgi:hypothetical protein